MPDDPSGSEDDASPIGGDADGSRTAERESSPTDSAQSGTAGTDPTSDDERTARFGWRPGNDPLEGQHEDDWEAISRNVGVDDVPPPSGRSRSYAEVQRTFWLTVVLVNVAVLAVSLGLMFVGFRGRWRLGLGLVALGFVAAGMAYARYRAFVASGEEDADRSQNA